MITIYKARKIITMNPARPQTSHVAVRDGRILGTGSLEELTGWGDYVQDEQFADKIIMPGLVEGHCHAMEGTLWRYVYCGFFDRRGPDGKIWPGLTTVDALLNRLKEADEQLENPDQALAGWSLDPIYFNNSKITRQQLDSVSSTRPIGILHASGHIMSVNSKALELADWLHQGVDHPGVPLGEDGLPTGELKGPDVMTPISVHIGFNKDFLNADEQGLRAFSRLCVRAGVTTATDLAASLQDEAVDMMSRVTGEDDFPVRVVALRFHHGLSPADLIEHVLELKGKSTDRLRLGKIKVVADGSIQGFSARLRSPGYYTGAPNGLWYITPEHMKEIFTLAMHHDIQVHTHTNGDEATELVLEILEKVLQDKPSLNHRLTLQHCQLADASQFRKMATLNLCVNHFANHHFYWGDEHYRLTVGPERAQRMNACRTALENGIPLAIHSDAPITPLGPLFTAWCAVNRLTASGRTLGEYEKISVAQALRAITLGAAYTLKLDDEVGSIEAGKRADFAILTADPESVGPVKLKDVGVWGTVQAGRVFCADTI